MALDVNTETRGEVLVVRLIGELDHHHADRVKSAIESIIEKDEIQHIVLSLSELQFMDSSGIGMILGRYKQITQKGGKMVICSTNPTIYRMMELAGLLKILKVEENEREALSQLGVA